MKRFFLWILVIMSITSSIQVFATESVIQKIYKIESYEWNDINNTYDYLWHGSAVLIGKNKIITNAHVVLNDEDIPTGNYNLCISDGFEKMPNCRIALKLLKYDKTNDLALLEPITDIALGNPVESSDRKLTLGEAAKVYGYPANGGQTITLTEGKVSWLDNGHYKIDANIDAGNSGGGAFDKDGKFIGIPYSASVGYSTLGYIIPINTIRDFMAWNGDIIEYGKTYSKFLKYINKSNTSILTQKIDNPSLKFDGFETKGFVLEGVNEKPNSRIASYILYSKTWNTSITISVPEIYGQSFVNETLNIESFKASYATVLEKKNITLGGKKISSMMALMGLKKDDGTIDKNVIFLYFTLENGLYYMIETENYNSEKKAISTALTLFVKNLKIQQDLQLIHKTQYVNSAGSFDILPGMNLLKWVAAMQFLFDTNMHHQGTIEITKSYDGEWKNAMNSYTFEEMGQLIMKQAGLDESTATTSAEIKKNTQGVYYLHVKGSGKGGVVYIDIFYTKVDNLVYSTIIKLTLPKESSELETKYYQFINTVTQKGTLPFKSATVWKVNLKTTVDAGTSK